MNPRPLVIFGASPFARAVARYFTEEGGRTLAAYTVHEKFMPAPVAGGVPMLAFERIADALDPAGHDIFIALEHSRQNLARAQIIDTAAAAGFGIASHISPRALVAGNVRFGGHMLVMEGTIIQDGCAFGDNNIVGAGSFFGFNVAVGSHNYFDAQCFADQGAQIGSHCILGPRACIFAGVRLEDWSQVRGFQNVEASPGQPVFSHRDLRAVGRVVDRRRPA